MARTSPSKVRFFDNNSLFPTVGSSEVIYVDKNSKIQYLWNGSAYIAMNSTGGEKTFESYSKNLQSYPYVITETSSTVTTIVYTIAGGNITKTITEVSPTVTTIVLSGAPPGIPTTKTITEGATISITYS